MGAKDAVVGRYLDQESKNYVGAVYQDGPGTVPIVADDLNHSEDITIHLLRRLAIETLGNGFGGDAFKIVGSNLINDFSIHGGDGTDDGAEIGYLGGLILRNYQTHKFSSPVHTDIHSKSTALSASSLKDSASKYTANELVGRLLYPNILNGTGFTITSNTENEIFVTGNMLSVATVGDRYRIGVTTPTSSRTDTVILDVYLDQIDAEEDPNLYHNIAQGSGTLSVESAIRKKVEKRLWIKQNSTIIPQSTHLDSDGNRHYVTRLASWTRASGVSQIANSAITDLRAINYAEKDRRYKTLYVNGLTSLSSTFSGTAVFWNNPSNHTNIPFFSAGVTINGAPFKFGHDLSNLPHFDFEFTVKSNAITLESSGTNIFTGVNNNFKARNQFTPTAVNNLGVVFKNYLGTDKSWFDHLGRLTVNDIAHFRQLLVRPSGSSERALEIQSDTGLRVFSVTENGEIFHSNLDQTIVQPYYDMIISSTSISPAVRLKGSGTSMDSFLNIENILSTYSNPLLRLKTNSTPGSGDFIRAERLAEANNPSFQVTDYGLVSARQTPSASTPVAGFSANDGSDVARFLAQSTGFTRIRPTSSSATALQITENDLTERIRIVGSGTIQVKDNGAATPGLLVQTSAGTNRVRVNVNGLVLTSAQVTQNSSSPTTLDVLSNAGIVIDYDENDDNDGTLQINAGSEIVALFDVKNNLLASFYGRVHVGNSGGKFVKIVPVSTGGLLFADDSVDKFQISGAGDDFQIKILDLTAFPTSGNILKFNRVSDDINDCNIILGDFDASDSIDEIGFGSKKITVASTVSGEATLSGTSVTVANTSISASSNVFLTAKTAAPAGRLFYTNVVAGTSFDIRSSSSESSIAVKWFIVTPSSTIQ